MLFKEIIAVYSENHAKPINTKCNILTIKADGSYNYRSALKGRVLSCNFYFTPNPIGS
jgi:hypothetical protein